MAGIIILVFWITDVLAGACCSTAYLHRYHFFHTRQSILVIIQERFEYCLLHRISYRY
jgi:hypothetical protein